MSQIRIVNMISKGQLDQELDLEALLNDIDIFQSYIKGPGLYLKFDKDAPVVTLARSGKFFSSGAKNFEDLSIVLEKLSDLLYDLGVISDRSKVDMDIANIVTLQDLEINIDLAAFALSLGFECVEYEPEQFPGLVYKPSNYSTTALVFASGKVIVTGSDELSTSKEVHSLIESLLTEEFNK